MRGATPIILGVFVFVTSAGTALAQQTGEVASMAECTKRPPNIELDERQGQLFEHWLGQSPTLRRQCGAIATTTSVRVRVLDARTPLVGCRARTTITRYEFGALRAVIELPQGVWRADLLGHELEHVLEQIEGLDLTTLSRHRRSGVREWGPAIFETTRARVAGRAVAAEIAGIRDR